MRPISSRLLAVSLLAAACSPADGTGMGDDDDDPTPYEFKTPEVRQRMDLQRLLALVRSALRLGIVGRERFHYWKLLAWTALRRPRLLPRAVTLAIYGHHFRRVAELHVL